MNHFPGHYQFNHPNQASFYGINPVTSNSPLLNNIFNNASYDNFHTGLHSNAPQTIPAVDLSSDSSAASSSSSGKSLQLADTRPLGPPTENTAPTKNLTDSDIFGITSSPKIGTQQISPSACHNFVFTSTNRNDLVRLVLDREYDKLPQIPSIESSRFMRIRNEILEILLRELPGTYYTPHVKKTQHSKAPLPVDLNTQQQLDFISKKLEPWSDVIINWESTFDVRQQTLKTLNDVQVYFDTFPCLKQPQGYQLLESDFNKLYPDKAKNLSDKWPTFRMCIIELLRTSREPKTDAVKNIVSKFSMLEGGKLLWVLFSMIKRSTSLIKTDLPGDPAEVQRGFLFHIKTLDDKEESIEKVKEFMRNKKLQFQPRPVIVGPIEKLESIEVLINNTYYEAKNILEAIKKSFFFALRLKYPPEARSTWLLIQKVIFDINTKDDENLSMSLTMLIGDIK
ncbi:hypothetical protein KQX54_012586 [Cotesia glomerata]|uniref:Uncharacterized protein n=1 Tax=Cotesia glomerata TaxID=32391 RepID=A0AAV7HSJ8_COTGL|nr:hypothetical protein KQX54_012586 [Cotesia glomerata]